ncbi:MAG: SDR family oxidoreductase [Gammaproteobacteria bacterium]|nr:MAG: SDR family oxidoreductase [Gammaproteobacteria bacterium]
MDLALTGHRALITGSHRGTGEVIARCLAEEGASVVVHGFEQAAAEAVAASIPNAVAVAGDLFDDEGARSVWQAANEAGTVDILINNYGRSDRGDFEQTPAESWHTMYEHNVLSASRLISLALPKLRSAPWGRIINLGTAGTQRPGAANPHYYAAKGALVTLTESLARELAGTAIRVNLVSPGIIHTPEVETWMRQTAAREGWGEDWSAIERQAVATRFPNAAGRFARREEIADLVCFLASPRADYIHGQNLFIDGGEA